MAIAASETSEDTTTIMHRAQGGQEEDEEARCLEVAAVIASP